MKDHKKNTTEPKKSHNFFDILSNPKPVQIREISKEKEGRSEK